MTDQPFATGTTGPFRGVGPSGYEQNPKQNKKNKPKEEESKVNTLLKQLLAEAEGGNLGSATNQDVTKFYNALLQGDPTAIRIRQLMIANGIVSANAKLGTVVSAYQDVISDLADFKAIGQTYTIEQMISRIGAFNTPVGSGTPKGPVSSISEVDYGKADVGDKSQGARQARKQIQEFFRESIGRVGTAEEIEEMRVALVKASAKAKPVTTVVREGNKTITKTTPGFDLKSWAAGYISTKFADEDVSGTLGEAQDKLKSLARAYGVDMGESWYAAATKQVGRGKAVEDFLDEIKQVAIGRYPGLADRFEKGASTIQVASPYIRAKARILEMDEDMIDLDDMDIQQAIGYKDEAGKYGTKPLWQYEKDLRMKPEWQYTKNAKDSYDTLMLKVLRDFGLMG